MRKLARLHIAVVLLRAVLEDRDAHLADLSVLRYGVAGVPLTRKEKGKVIYSMVRRTGERTRDVWVPPALLWIMTRGVKRNVA